MNKLPAERNQIMKKTNTFAPKAIIAKTAEMAQERALQVQETAQNVWYAGLGALALAEDRSGKLFKELVKKGEAIDLKNKKIYSGMVKDVEARIEFAKETVVDATSGTYEKISGGLENGMASVMHTFGVPTRNEIKTLTKKVDLLTQSVDKKAKKAITAGTKKVRKATAAARGL
jgi:poly(hydroxyalkanoate) granule-associated protein